MIPKILHLVWLSGTPRPPVYDRLLDRFRKINPTWTVKVWDETACVINRNALNWLPPTKAAYRSDVVRYEVLARYGGVYADWDIVWRRPLDPLCSLGAFIGYESHNILCNAVIGAIPWHPYTTALVTRLPDSCNLFSDPSHGVGVHFATRTVTDFRAGVSLLPKALFHRLHGDGAITPEETSRDNGVEFGTHLYNVAYGAPFVEAVEQFLP